MAHEIYQQGDTKSMLLTAGGGDLRGRNCEIVGEKEVSSLFKSSNAQIVL